MLDLPTKQSQLDVLLKPSIKIGDTASIVRTAGNGVELASMKFGFPPPRKGAGPVFNIKSEGRHFADSNRCLIPASSFFEFTGTKHPRPGIASG